jgi:hypothetical protein
MHEAIHEYTTTRSDAFPEPVAAPPRRKPQHPDAELLALAAQFGRLQEEIRPLTAKFFALHMGNMDEIEAVGAAECALVNQQDDLAERAKSISARTLAGYRAKAVIAREILRRSHRDEIAGDYADEDIDFVWAMVSDMLQLSVRAGL